MLEYDDYVRHYNNFKNHCILLSNKSSYRCIIYDLNELVECPNCHKKVKAGDAYTSQFWFEGRGIFGLMICEDCHNEENKIIAEVRSHLEKRPSEVHVK